jgi:ABC-type lipoprotein export system ATPase subunit
MNNPKFILADKPTGNRDIETTENIIEQLYEINKEDTNMIMNTIPIWSKIIIEHDL